MLLLENEQAQMILNYLQTKPLPAKETFPLIQILTSAPMTKEEEVPNKKPSKGVKNGI